MAGKINILVKKGIAKAPFLKYYPYWRWKVKGDNGVETIITPTWENLKEIIKLTMQHEKLVDTYCFNRSRNDNRKYKEFIKAILEECSNEIEFDTTPFDLNVYKNAVGGKDGNKQSTKTKD